MDSYNYLSSMAYKYKTIRQAGVELAGDCLRIVDLSCFC